MKNGNRQRSHKRLEIENIDRLKRVKEGRPDTR
jgi:hypothetical protein